MSSIGSKNRLALPEGGYLGKYYLLSVLGSGGFGITYLAEDTVLKRRVAIKELLPSDIAVRLDGATVSARDTDLDEDFTWARQRFIEEGQALAACEHDSVVQIYDIFQANGTGYLVTRFLEGAALPEWLKQLGRRPSEGEMKSLLNPLLCGLEVVHANGFLHRDIKPDNVFVTTEGRPILLDFGSARQAITNRSCPMTSIVTPGYAPFEQYQSESFEDEDNRQGPWTDIYALAGVMIYAITGQKPLAAPSRIGSRAKLQALLSEDESLRKDFTLSFLTAIDAAFAVEAEDRPQSVGEWRGMLERTAQEGSVQGYEKTAPKHDFQLLPETVDQSKPKSEVSVSGDLQELAGSSDAPETVGSESKSVPENKANRKAWLGVTIALVSVAFGLLSFGHLRNWFGYAERTSSDVNPDESVSVMLGQKTGESRDIGGIDMVWCPPADGAGFLMGSLEDESGRNSDENQHTVFLTSGFWIAKTECTQEQWSRIMGGNPSQIQGKENLPVVNVSWDDVQEWLSIMNNDHPAPDGWIWGLPTEAQWEFACRAGTETAWYFGSDRDQLYNFANFADTNIPIWGDTSQDDGVGPETAEVGSYLPNDWGLFDMHGNVSEWCSDWYQSDYYEDQQEDPSGPDNGTQRVQRGGNFLYLGAYCRSANRSWAEPDSESFFVGFRPVLIKSMESDGVEK